jgi:type IV pilus assembly protein PilY1
MGLMVFNYSEGGRVIEYVEKLNQSKLDTFLDKLNRPICDSGQSSGVYYNTTWTPLAETIYEGIRFFSQLSPYYSSSDYSLASGSHPERDPMYNEDYSMDLWCARNYIILLTDGESTQDTSIPNSLKDADGDGHDPFTSNPFDSGGSTYLDDVTYYAFNNDLRSDLENDQTITTHTIFMFGKKGEGDTLLDAAAENGGGDYFLAKEADEIKKALESIFADITKEAASAASVAVTSEAVSGENRIYIPYYKHPGKYRWNGNIRAFNLDDDGNLTDASGNLVTDSDDDGIYDNPVWDAEDMLEKNKSRYIFTIDGSANETEFSFSNLSSFKSYLDVDLDANGTEDEDNEANALMKYIRGEDPSFSGYTFRDRDGWVLGDIIHSKPVVVGVPRSYFDVVYGDDTYSTFYNDNKDRQQAIYVGGNDGILHALNTDTGSEMWGYIPRNLLPHLKWLADPSYCHCYYMDSIYNVADIKVGGTWQSYILGSMRLGGTPASVDTDDNGTKDSTFRSAFFTIDVTNPTSPDVKAEVTDDRFGYTFSVPIAVKVGDNWYAIFGSGPKNRNGEGNSTEDGYSDQNGYIFVINPENGSIVHCVNVSDAANNFFGSPVAVDYDMDYNVDAIYIGDAKGNLWRIKTFTGSGGSKTYNGPSSWTVFKVLSLGSDQPILGKPALSIDDQNRLWVYVGTGRYFCTGDNEYCGDGNTCPDSGGCSVTEDGETRSKFLAVGVYDGSCGNDTLATSTRDLSDLDHRVIISGSLVGGGGTGYTIVDATTGDIATDVSDGKKGWYFHLSEDKERIVGDPLAYRGVAFFMSYIPVVNIEDPCSWIAGRSKLYGVNYMSGTALKEALFGKDEVQIGGEEGKEVATSIVELSKGSPGGGPVPHDDTIYTPLGEPTSVNLPEPPLKSGLVSWREIWD